MSNKCTADTLCTHLAAQIVKDDKPGFTKLEQMVRTENGPKVGLHSVCYRKTLKDKFFAIQVCPWCEGEPGFYKRVRDSEQATIPVLKGQQSVLIDLLRECLSVLNTIDGDDCHEVECLAGLEVKCEEAIEGALK